MANPAVIKNYVDKYFARWGINKKRQIVRLAYEISKRDHISVPRILSGLKDKPFSSLKQTLTWLRYPYAYSQYKHLNIYLPELSIDPANRQQITRFKFLPQDVFFEKGLGDSFLVGRLKHFYPQAVFTQINSLKEYCSQERFSITGYNTRSKRIFIVKERYDHCKVCPCTTGALQCGYQVLNIGFGCAFECSYCFLQEYQNIPGIILPANLDDFFNALLAYKPPKGIFPYMRIGSGEFTDSLIFDHISEFSLEIMDFFKRLPRVYFEFKTKSTNIENILKSRTQKNIIISWSLNPDQVINENEFYTASLKERLDAAKVCIQAGFKVGFHFDPILYFKDWDKSYSRLVNMLLDKIAPKHIAWISLGTLRFSPQLKKIIENRFPDNRILDEELLLDFDEKLRYPSSRRVIIYQNMLVWIRKHSPKLPVYLCMEDRSVWQQVKV